MHDYLKPKTVFLLFSMLLLLEAGFILSFVYFVFVKHFKANLISSAGDNAVIVGRMIPLIEPYTFYGLFRGSQSSAHQLNEFRHHLFEHVKGFNVVKIKMFNRDYRVIYSTDAADINRVDKNNTKLKSALEGNVARRFIKNKHFEDASNVKPFTASVVSTYFPVMYRNSKSIIGAYEIYINVNRNINLSKAMAWQAFLWVAVILFPMFFLLFIFMHHNMKELNKAQQANVLLYQQRLNLARNAGQADIAASILHNVGNMITSSSVSLDLLREYCKAFNLEKLQKLVVYFQEHRESLAQDSTGKLIPEYLEQVSAQISKQLNSIKDEIAHLTDHIQKMQAIVFSQTSLIQFHGLVEKISLKEVIQTAVTMSLDDNFQKQKITVKTEYLTSPMLVVDKAKLLEILVNLFLNARDAIMDNQHENKHLISVIVKAIEAENMIQISITDTGCGIADQNKIKIFSYGFTNKIAGKGIGLHISANLAKELGGQLILDDSTIGEGSCFSLILPRKLTREKRFKN